jgi:hypothetical protein
MHHTTVFQTQTGRRISKTIAMLIGITIGVRSNRVIARQIGNLFADH